MDRRAPHRVAEVTNWSRYASVQALIVQKVVHEPRHFLRPLEMG